MAEQFLTLMADLDEKSQELMSSWYNELKKAGFIGKQTPDLSYHISLATFALDQEKEVVKEMERLSGLFNSIPVSISHIGLFAGCKVLFSAPDLNKQLIELHDSISLDTIDQYGWTPHVTILIDEQEIIHQALPVLIKSFQPFNATITRLHLCAFWPTREIAVVDLK